MNIPCGSLILFLQFFLFVLVIYCLFSLSTFSDLVDRCGSCLLAVRVCLLMCSFMRYPSLVRSVLYGFPAFICYPPLLIRASFWVSIPDPLEFSCFLWKSVFSSLLSTSHKFWGSRPALHFIQTGLCVFFLNVPYHLRRACFPPFR
jgi:hypothetical protein